MELLWIILVILGAALVYGFMQEYGGRGRNVARSVAGEIAGKIPGDGTFGFEIVGESHYQDSLARIAGPKTEDGVDHECLAMLIPEPTNPHDENAVRVDISGMTVGYMSRPLAARWNMELKKAGFVGRAVGVDARIVGGWDRGRGDEGHYGVKLDLPPPDGRRRR